MKKIVYVCDRCGKEITGGILQIYPQYIERLSDDYAERQPFDGQLRNHYCEECTLKVMNMLNDPEAARQDAQQEDTPDSQETGTAEEEEDEDTDPEPDKPPGMKNKKIKVRNLPSVREFKEGSRGKVDKHQLYKDWLEMKEEKSANRILAQKYGCSPSRVSQIVKELSHYVPVPKDEGTDGC